MMKLLKGGEIVNEISNFDVFISSSGFEKRCLNVIKNINLNDKALGILFYINDFYKENIENKDMMVEILKEKKVKTQQYILKYNDPISSFKEMVKAIDSLREINKELRILIDISTFTHEHLLMLYRILTEFKIKATFCYNSVEEYSYSQNKNFKWLTRGIRDIRNIVGFPGISDPSRKNHLIIFMGFEEERVKKIITHFEFEKITLLYGSEEQSISLEHYKQNKVHLERLKETYPYLTTEKVSLVNIGETVSKLRDIIGKNKEYNHVVIPMNNKISTIAVGNYAIENEDVQLNYVSASEYNINSYSKASDEFYIIKEDE